MGIKDVIVRNEAVIKQYLELGYVNEKGLLNRLAAHEATGKSELKDEQLWTYLVACGYAVAGPKGVAKLAEILTQGLGKTNDSSKIWMEMLPLPPRQQEGNTHLDLAVGCIVKRESTDSGIELADEAEPWVCFCEMKWDSDIATSVTYDPARNQLARVIENALCFQNKQGKYADKVFVTLVTPVFYLDERPKSRLYYYKYEDYMKDPQLLSADLDNCLLKKATYYPECIDSRINALKLNWITYDNLFDLMPESPLCIELCEFWRGNNKQ